MALTYSPQVETGSKCPEFSLQGVDGKVHSMKDFAHGKALVVMFICNHCPYVRAIEDRVLETHRRLRPKGVNFVAICSNDPTDYPEDRPEALKQRWLEKEYGFPYLVDTSQEVARQFGAVCTPDFFVFDRELKLGYRGRLDDSWKDPAKVSSRELELAALALASGGNVEGEQHPSMGCSIKWRE